MNIFQKSGRADPFQARARELCAATGVDPDSRVYNGTLDARGHPAWTDFRDAAKAEHVAAEQAKFEPKPQDPKYQGAPMFIVGDHEESTIQQMRNCMTVGNVVAGGICADGHLGYAQPVGGVVAYEDQISISGVGYDIACGNMAVKLEMPYSAIKDEIGPIMQSVFDTISFGVGRTNDDMHVDHPLFDEDDLWKRADREDYRQKARAQLGTVGSGNHYVDIFEDENGLAWIGVHFGSRGLGHTTATKYLKLAGGKDGIHVAPTVIDAGSELGERYLAGMHLAGQYAYAGREWVVERVRKILGSPRVIDSVHNHHNFAWYEQHDGKSLWVVRKGATPAWPGQKGFVGGSMGDNAVILVGKGSSDVFLHSTVHGAGRTMSRNDAKRRFTREQMDDWLRVKGVTLVGGDLDESPMAYRRLDEVLAAHRDTVEVQHVLKPRGVAMAGSGTFDPFKD